VIEAILKILNGKEYYNLTKKEVTHLRDREYKKAIDLYIVISSTFILFGSVILFLVIKEIIGRTMSDVMLYLIVGITVFQIVVLILLFVQKASGGKGKLRKVRFDFIINSIILVFLTSMTLANIQTGEYLGLYAAGLITFAFFGKAKPSFILLYFAMILVLVFSGIKILEIEIYSIPAFTINVIALNIIVFYAARILFVEHIKNFTHQKKIYEQNGEFEKLAAKDFLTNLYNRRGFSKRIEEPLMCPASICLFDLDGLKLINDALGHEKGDKAILFTVKNIKESFENAFRARLGGDEFAVIIENANEKDVAEMVRRFGKKMKQKNETGINVSASVGCAMINSQDQIMEAYNKAENIMYHLKLGARSSRKNRSMEALLISLYNYTGESERHCHTVGHIAQQVLAELGYKRKAEVEAIKTAGLLHDIGKLSIPESILKKVEKLTDNEWEIIKSHSKESYKIACGLIDDKNIVEAVLYHHERWDGKGYPYNIKGEEIPLFARILSVADAYDAMVSERCYSGKKTHEEACGELVANKGSQFDPTVVESFLKLPAESLRF